MWGLAIGAGLGLAKSQLVDKPREKRQRELRAREIELSPWTGNTNFSQIKEQDAFGSALKYGATGMALNQAYANANGNTNTTDQAYDTVGKDVAKSAYEQSMKNPGLQYSFAPSPYAGVRA